MAAHDRSSDQPDASSHSVNRRRLLQGSAGAALAGMGLAAPTGRATSWAQSGGSASMIEEVPVDQLRKALDAGEMTVRELVQACLDRIAAMDQTGPTLRAVIETNPDAPAIADALDKELAEGQSRGPLHGIPVLIKDNIATADQMQTTAGSYALEGAVPMRDAFIAQRLRDAGAVIVGKANLSEWANIRSSWASSGWSGRGGQAVNPYQLDRNASGSSSGSAIAVAASYVPLAVGTETDGSIISPSAHCGVVGIKPTVGLVSRSGIIPISHWQDTAGPMARSVAEAAMLLNVLAADDPDDPAQAGGGTATPEASPEATLEASPGATPAAEAPPSYPARPQGGLETIDYTSVLDENGLEGAKIGVLRSGTSITPATDANFEAALQSLRDAGAELVDPVELPSQEQVSTAPDELEVLLWDTKWDIQAYIEAYVDPSFPVRTLADIVEFNRVHADLELPWFGQDLFERAVKKSEQSDPEYLATVARTQRWGRAEGIDAIIAQHDVDAIVAPANAPATKIDLVNGDRYLGGITSAAAIAGYPIVTVPSGEYAGLPLGLGFIGTAFSEATLIKLAHAFEQATKARSAPTYAEPAVLPPAPAEGEMATPEASPANEEATPAR
jgi:amidase